jgi:hypothetical protein
MDNIRAVTVTIVFTKGSTMSFVVPESTILISPDRERLLFCADGKEWVFRLANIAGYGVAS